jgi:hypothetical protein
MLIIVGTLILLFGLYGVVTGLLNWRVKSPKDKTARVGWGIIFALVGRMMILW